SRRSISWRRSRLRFQYAWANRKTELLLSVALPALALLAAVSVLAIAGADALAKRTAERGTSGGAFGDALRLLVPAGSIALVIWFVYTRLRVVAQRISDRVLSYLRLPSYRDHTGLQNQVTDDLRFAYRNVSTQIGRRRDGESSALPAPKVVVFI